MTIRQIDNLNREIAQLKKSEARERQKQADLLGKINRATNAASRTSSTSTRKSKLREIENRHKDLARVETKIANLAT